MKYLHRQAIDSAFGLNEQRVMALLASTQQALSSAGLELIGLERQLQEHREEACLLSDYEYFVRASTNPPQSDLDHAEAKLIAAERQASRLMAQIACFRAIRGRLVGLLSTGHAAAQAAREKRLDEP